MVSSILLAHAIAKHALNYTVPFVSDPCSFAECQTITLLWVTEICLWQRVRNIIYILTIWVIWSLQANRILSQVAGLSIRNTPSSPLSFLADPIASLMAKNTEAARKSGGSPTACIKQNETIIHVVASTSPLITFEEKMALGLGVRSIKETLNWRGMSELEGIL